MQIIGFSFRILSSFVWVQMYRLGASSENTNPSYHDTEYDARNSFLNQAGGVARENSISDEILGGSIYDPAYYSSLFKDVRDNGCIHEVQASFNILNLLFCLTVYSSGNSSMYMSY